MDDRPRTPTDPPAPATPPGPGTTTPAGSPGGTDEVVHLDGVVKTFGTVRALDGLTMSVTRGEVHGFLGPNGAGKSTALRVLLGLLRPDSGTARVLGGDPWRDAVPLHRRLAYVPGDVRLWPNLTGGETIDLFARLRGRPDRRRRDALCERFDLDPTRKGRTYSKGNRQKVALIAALAGDVELLLLDEPTSGLDPLMEAVFQEEVRALRAQGTTVLLSSHVLAQVEALADRVSIIRRGRVVETGTLTDLRHLTRTTVTVRLDPGTDAPTSLATLPGVHDVHREHDRVRFDVDGDHVADTVRALAPWGVRAITAHPPTLEQLLLRHYRDDPATAPAGDAATGGDPPRGSRDAGPATTGRQ